MTKSLAAISAMTTAGLLPVILFNGDLQKPGEYDNLLHLLETTDEPDVDNQRKIDVAVKLNRALTDLQVLFLSNNGIAVEPGVAPNSLTDRRICGGCMSALIMNVLVTMALDLADDSVVKDERPALAAKAAANWLMGIANELANTAQNIVMESMIANGDILAMLSGPMGRDN